MRRLLLLAGLLISRNASANQCPALQEFAGMTELPLGCPFVVYQDHDWHQGAVPSLHLERSGMALDLTPTSITTESELLAVYIESIDENCVEHNGEQLRTWDRMTFGLGSDVQVGDVVRAGYGAAQAIVIAAGPCPAPSPTPAHLLYCQDPIQEYWACEQPDPDPMPDPEPEPPGLGNDIRSCNAGGGSGGGLGLVAAALLVGLRRRRATARATSRR